MRRLSWIPLVTGLALWAIGVACRAEEEKTPVANLTLYPAAEPSPALKYQLTVPVHERRPGNAAVLYNRITAQRTRLFGRGDEFWEKLSKLSEAPLAELREKGVQETLGQVQDVVRDLDTAALYETCDWQVALRHEPVWETLLPDVQQTRLYVRCLAPYVRWQIAQGQYDEAVRSFRSGYALARNVGRGPSLIHNLIGAAIAGIMNQQMETFIQQPDAPNLYWALRSLPRPVIDFRPGLETEMDAVYLSFPELCNLDKKKYPSEQWQALLNETIEKYEQARLVLSDKRPRAKLSATEAITSGYPRAKQYFIEQGRSAAEVAAMPAAQAVLLYTMATYDEMRDGLLKWWLVPYCDGRKRLESADKKLSESEFRNREIIPFASELLPGVRLGKSAETRIDRDFAALVVVEAIRLYAASHKGELPDGLADITEVPVPVDPFTGQPFVYRRDGKTAMLESLTPDAGKSVRYRIEMRSKEKKNGK